jgi:hypothetical protein
VLKPQSPPADHAKLHGVLIGSKGFPGWENVGGFTAHMHHLKVERVAIVTVISRHRSTLMVDLLSTAPGLWHSRDRLGWPEVR